MRERCAHGTSNSCKQRRTWLDRTLQMIGVSEELLVLRAESRPAAVTAGLRAGSRGMDEAIGRTPR